MAPRIPPAPAEVSIRSERDAYAEAISPGDVGSFAGECEILL